MTTTKLNEKAIAVTRLPEGATKFYVDMIRVGTTDDFSEQIVLKCEYQDFCTLPDEYANARILGFAQDLGEDDWRQVVSSLVIPSNIFGRVKNYMDYVDDEYSMITAKDSGHSLLKSKGLYVSNPYPNPDATKVLGGSPSGSDYEVLDELKEQWQSAQLLTNPLILVIE